MKRKITIMVLGLLGVPSISLGAPEVLSEVPVSTKAPVGKLSMEEVEKTAVSSGSEEGYEADHDSDEAVEVAKRGMRSSASSTPNPERKKSKSPKRGRLSQAKEKLLETMESVKDRMKNHIAESDSDEDEDSAYADSVGSRSPNRSLSPVREDIEDALTALSKLAASGLTADQMKELEAARRSLMKQETSARPSSLPPSAHTRQASERRESRIRRGQKQWSSENKFNRGAEKE